MSTLERLSDRIWLTYQAALEYHRNLATTLADEADRYDKVDKELKGIQESLAKTRGHPFTAPNLLKEFRRVSTKLSQDFVRRRDELRQYLNGHPLQARLAKLFEGKVGEQFSPKELDEIYKDGESRYRRKQPPGFKDGSKDDPERRFGDLVVWREILRYAKERAKDFILITNDKKEDWFRELSGQTIGPRPELIGEFHELVGRRFHLYDVANFLKYAKEYIKANVADDAIKEAQELPARTRTVWEHLRPPTGIAASAFILPGMDERIFPELQVPAAGSLGTFDALTKHLEAAHPLRLATVNTAFQKGYLLGTEHSLESKILEQIEQSRREESKDSAASATPTAQKPGGKTDSEK